MANENGRTTIDLVKPFIANGHRYGFYQAIRWLNNLSQGLKEQNLDPIRLKILPQLSLDFIGNDIRDVSFDEKTNTVEIIVTFLALYGTASPLPTFYTEDLIFEVSEDVTVAKDFLDIFHGILYQKLYDLWLKYKLNQCAFEHQDKRYIDRLYNLIGIGDQSLRKLVPNHKSLIKYIGLLSQQPRSAKNLETMLKDYFGVAIKITSSYQATQRIEKAQQTRLGLINCQLSRSTYLGCQIKERSSSIALDFYQLSKDDLNLFSYRQTYAIALSFLIKFFCSTPTKCFVRLHLKKGEASNAQLGSNQWGKLGQNTWILPSDKDDYTVSYIIE